MSSRAAIIGSGGFPPILKLFLETVKVWQNEVDAIYIAIDKLNFSQNPSYITYAKNLCKEFPKVTLLTNTRMWPESYNDALNICKEDTVLILHDDTLIHKKGVVDTYFKIAEKGKVVTPLHEIYAPKDLVEVALHNKYPRKFPLSLKWRRGSPSGWEGYSFLLYFLFAPKQAIIDAGACFGTDRLTRQEAINLLGVDSDEIGGDTGFILGLNFFKNKVKVVPIPRYETVSLSHTDDPLATLKQWKEDKEQIFDSESGWFHLQNTGNTFPLWFKRDLSMFVPWEAKHHEVRLAWFRLMLDLEDYADIPGFKEEAEVIFDKVMKLCNARATRIEEMKSIFSGLLWQRQS